MCFKCQNGLREFEYDDDPWVVMGSGLHKSGLGIRLGSDFGYQKSWVFLGFWSMCFGFRTTSQLMGSGSKSRVRVPFLGFGY